MGPLLQSPQPHRGHVRTPSPNYFGFTAQDESYDSESNRHTRKNWSPPSSAVRSTAAFSPTVIPVDQNPDFDAFRRQSETVGFSLGSLHDFDFKKPALPSTGSNNSNSNINNNSFFNNINISASPKPSTEQRQMPPSGRAPSGSISGGRAPSGSISGGRAPSGSISGAGNNFNLDPEAAYQGRSPKRHLSNDSSFPDGLRSAPERPSSQPRLNMPFNLNLPPQPQFKPRAETVPAAGPLNDSDSFITPQHLCNLLDSAAEEMLILDLRVSTQYAGAHLRGALNLCIPTTLLKRPSFNVSKLAETFKDDADQRRKFENWKSSKYIIVYDSASFQLKDATSCVNTIKKFDSEGVEGKCYILKGGFAEFAKKHPSHIERAGGQASRAGAPMSMKLDMTGPEIAPVIGGCPMPVEKNAANPFFGNIRQNMDLIGGVGQMEVKRPANLSKEMQDHFPPWLQSASDEKDKGARVSEKFLQIEKREQKRMQEALSGKVSYGSPTQSMPKSSIQIAGIEKGSKNRYNNIWPFEHSRVKLQDVPSHGCDYFNANYITSKRSHKRYIATQGPIPATFADFWNVIWQQETRVIVMLTAEKEGGQVKAHNYWSDKQYGPIRLEFLSEKRASLDPAKIKRHRQQRPSVGARKSTDGAILARIDTTTSESAPKDDQPYVIVRKLALRHEGYPFERMREITQLQYSSWPDFGAPAHPAHLLGLVEQCEAVVRSTTHSSLSEPDPPEAPPIVVHCSAGCGRTGTFCTVATVIDQLKRQRSSRRRQIRDSSPMHIDTRRSSVQMKDSSPFFAAPAAPVPSSEEDEVDGQWVDDETQDLIEKTVEEFRKQRISMVQSLRQFVLCYESVMEWLVEQESED
ncbi:phosphotyrosine-specific Ptp2-like protein, partial [Aureobasidium melanogenum]